MLGVKTGRERRNLGTHSKARETLEEEEIGNACKEAIVFSVFHAIRSGGSSPSDEGGPGHPDPEIRGRGGGVQKKFFRTFVWSRNKGGRPPVPSHGSAADLIVKIVLINWTLARLNFPFPF